MNFQAILVANVTAFILIYLMCISRFLTRTKPTTRERIFDVILGLAMVACVVEPLAYMIDGIPGTIQRYMNILANTYLHYANATGVFFFCMYVDLSLNHDKIKVKRKYGKISIFVGLILLSLILNIFFGFYFYVDEQNVYHRQPLVSLFYVYVLVGVLYSMFIFISHRRRTGYVPFLPVHMFLIPIVTGSILQMLFYGVSLAWLGAAVGAVALYMSMLKQKSYTDELTGLYNRMYLEHVIYVRAKSETDSFYGIMIDMDYFKTINDTFGHSAGDRALSDMASFLKKRFPVRTWAFRYAGDEFIILAMTPNEDEVIEIENSIREMVRDFNKSGLRPYTLSFSMGHDRFYPGVDDEDSFLNKIDKAMYECKKLNHEGDLERK